MAQGYGSSSTYGNFEGLADAKSSFNNSNLFNSLYYSGTQTGIASINIGTLNSPDLRMPRYNNTNTSTRATDEPSVNNGGGGNYWSSDPSNNTEVYVLNLASRSVYPGDSENFYRDRGLSIRCVADS